MSESTITPVSGWRVTCSVCRQHGPADDSISRAVELARAAGWVAVVAWCVAAVIQEFRQ